jgi:acyl-CoA dehydrogenase
MDPNESRQLLRDWLDGKPANFFESAQNLQNVLRMYLGSEKFEEIRPALLEFGQRCATVIDPAAILNDRIGNHPQLDGWSDIGERTEEIQFHPSYHAAGRPAYESGILALQAEPGHAVEQATYFFLLAHCGEMGHACPIACTSGMIRALQNKGSDALKEKYLPPLLDPKYDTHQIAAQFITEVQGGSDVGANACLATPMEDQPGAWRINGEKWFCSVANADQFLVSARPLGAVGGTKGLGVFLVPRRLDGGAMNGVHIRRLKDKFGTRTMATAEMDFVDAVGYQIGAVDEGFKIIIEMVLNVSRWLNSVGSVALMQRSFIEAWTFARHRPAFGASIFGYPLVQEALAEIKAEVYAGMASTFRLSHLVDRIDTGQATKQERSVYRLLVNINKYWTSIAASFAIRRAQEVFGGNGAVESFSVVPRLYRDSVVFESWEGSHNVLCLQVMRDALKYRFHADYFDYIAAQLDSVTRVELMGFQETCMVAMERVRERLGRVLGGDPDLAQTHIRRGVDEMAALTGAACLLAEAEWELSQGIKTDKLEVLQFYLNRHLVPGYDPLDDPDYRPRLARICASASC